MRGEAAVVELRAAHSRETMNRAKEREAAEAELRKEIGRHKLETERAVALALAAVKDDHAAELKACKARCDAALERERETLRAADAKRRAALEAEIADKEEALDLDKGNFEAACKDRLRLSEADHEHAVHKLRQEHMLARGGAEKAAVAEALRKRDEAHAAALRDATSATDAAVAAATAELKQAHAAALDKACRDAEADVADALKNASATVADVTRAHQSKLADVERAHAAALERERDARAAA